MNRKECEARIILPKGMKFITVLDFEVGRVFQYKVKGGFMDNGEYEEYLTNNGHNLMRCDWMVHDNPVVWQT